MKLFVLFSLLTAFMASASDLYVRETTVSINMNGATVKEVLDEIGRQTECTFWYRDKEVNLDRKVSLQVEDQSVLSVLNNLFDGQDLSYTVNNKYIVIYNNKAGATDSQVTQQSTEYTVTGTIKDAADVEIVGASVLERGTTNGTITDTKGNFSIRVSSPQAVLRIAYVGYQGQDVTVGHRTHINIVLHEDISTLDEVVVVGYGMQKKVNMTGSITNVKAKELTAIPVSNLSNTLAGRAPGVTIVGNSGLIGATSTIRVRGGFGEPLFVIDGILSNKEAFDALEANEVEQMSFLKDAATASVYGTSAGNGVVLVTTRGGSKDSKPVFTYQGSYSVSSTTKPLFTDLFTATDELIYQNRVAEFKNQALPNGDDEFEYFKNRDYNVNDYIWQNPWNTKHSLSVSGGNDRIQYFMMASYMKEEGSYISLENNKYNVRSNLTAKLTKAISLNMNLSAYQTSGRRFFWTGSGDDSQDVYDMYRCTFNATRTLPFYENLDGTPATEKTDYPIRPEVGSFTGWNPVDQVIGDRYIKTRKRNMNGTLTLNIDLGVITPGLSTKVLYNYTGDDYTRKKFMTNQKNYIFQRADPAGNRFLPGPLDLNQYAIFDFNTVEHLEYGMKTLWSQQFNWFVDYKRNFGKHGVTGMMVFETAKNGGEFVDARAEDPLAYIDQMFVFSSDRENRSASANEYTGAHQSWIGRFNYNYDEKYIAEFSFRYDGNTLFAPGKRWGFFPSFSAAWRLNKEHFMDNTSDWLSDLKLRLSYGSTGNDLDVNNAQITPFSYLPKYTSGTSYMFGSSYEQGITAGATPNPNITWATSRTYNVGVDYGFFNQRLTGAIDVFYRKETNILGARTVSLPSTYGQALAPENYAARSWRGGEFTLSWRDQALDGELSYTVYANMGYAKDRWDVLDESAVYKTGNLQALSKVGLSNGRQIGLIAVDIIRTQEQVDELKAQGFKQYGRDPYLGGILYKDTRGDGYSEGPDGRIDGNDSYNLLSDNAEPRMNYGFGGEVSWKGFTVSAHFQGVGPYDKFVSGADGNKGFQQYGGANRPYFPIWTGDDVWTPENPGAKYPRVVGSVWYESGAGITSFWKRNGAYIRLKNLNISYAIPRTLLRHVGLTQGQLFLNGTNLFSISQVNEFMDPEQAYYDSYPLMKTFTVGLNFSF